MAHGALAGTTVIVAGAGLAGLAAARELERDGARVMVLEAREHVGGRVHTLREGFMAGQHAEAGADLIEGEQRHVRDLAEALDLKPVRILRRGWAFYGPDNTGRRRVRTGPGAFGEAARRLQPLVRDYRLAEGRWDSAVAASIARRSVAEWLASERADAAFTAGVRGLRGFFLADPEDLSLIALVDQFASSSWPGGDQVFRIPGGNDTLPRVMANGLRGTIDLRACVRAIRRTDEGVCVVAEHRGRSTEIRGDYCVSALPASTLKDVTFDPALPAEQHRAIESLRYGPATRLVLQFARRFWRRATRPIAFGTDLPTGAVWDGNEEQRGRPGILSLLAGGRASAALQEILGSEGPGGVVRRLRWMGAPAPLIATHAVTWEADPWSRGGYAVFDPQFDPALRVWLARPAGRLVFAGEHTSLRWQGYMNGAIESGLRAAAEVRHQAAGH